MIKPIQKRHDAPEYLYPFLIDIGSLTKRLKKMAGSAVVKVISGTFRSADWWSHYYLNLQCDRLFQREILMTSGSYSCWYARSYIPAATWYGHSKFFEQLSNKILGDILFDNQHVQRVNCTYFVIGREDIPYYWPPKEISLGSDELWLRVSVFSFNDQADFYLIELFLPELQTCLQQVGQPTGD